MTPKVSVTLSANAGVAIDIGGRRIWVDALHDQKQPKFSTLSRQLQQQMLQSERFWHPEYICYTHCHPDHYSQRLTDAAAALWPNAKILAPEGKYGCVGGEEWCVEDRGLRLRFVKLPHEGEEYADVIHYGLIISLDGYHILIPGDCAVAAPKLAKATEGVPIDLMLLDFPWMTLPKGRAFLDAHFPDVVKVLLHLPFAEDDRFGYRIAAQRAAERCEKTFLLWQPLQTMELR